MEIFRKQTGITNLDDYFDQAFYSHLIRGKETGNIHVPARRSSGRIIPGKPCSLMILWRILTLRKTGIPNHLAGKRYPGWRLGGLGMDYLLLVINVISGFRRFMTDSWIPWFGDDPVVLSYAPAYPPFYASSAGWHWTVVWSVRKPIYAKQVNDKELKQEFYNIHEPKVKMGLNDHC